MKFSDEIQGLTKFFKMNQGEEGKLSGLINVASLYWSV